MSEITAQSMSWKLIKTSHTKKEVITSVPNAGDGPQGGSGLTRVEGGSRIGFPQKVTPGWPTCFTSI